MFLIDTKVTKTTPVNRVLEQRDWKKIFPKQVPRRTYYLFRYGKPTEVKEQEIADYLMEKFPSIKPTTMEIDKILAEYAQLNYNDLKKIGMRYEWSFDDVSIKKEDLWALIRVELEKYHLPMSEEKYEELKSEKKKSQNSEIEPQDSEEVNDNISERTD